jgi:hypothetical protein
VVIQFPHGKGFPVTARPMTRKKRAIQPMEKTIKGRRLPDTDSVEELAGFWDHHDLTDFQPDLGEVSEPVFVRAKGASASIELRPAEAQHLKRIARSKGVSETTVLRQWILERLHEFSPNQGPPDRASQAPARSRRQL